MAITVEPRAWHVRINDPDEMRASQLREAVARYKDEVAEQCQDAPSQERRDSIGDRKDDNTNAVKPLPETSDPAPSSLWEQSSAGLHPLDYSPYEDYWASAPLWAGTRELYNSWYKWSTRRAIDRTEHPDYYCPTFLQFDLLPPELRQRIWMFALPRPRVVRLAMTRNGELMQSDTFPAFTTTKNPVLLSVTRESRAVALRYFGIIPTLYNTQMMGPVYFDFNNDILFLSPELGNKVTMTVRNTLKRDIRLKIKRLALMLNELDIVMPTISAFPNRTELIMVLTSGNDEFSGVNENLRLDNIDLNTKDMTDMDGTLDQRASCPVDGELCHFAEKWKAKKAVHLTWKAPELHFATLECENVQTVCGLIRFYPPPGQGIK